MNNEEKDKKSNTPMGSAIFMLGLFVMLGLIACGLFVKQGISSLSQSSTISVKGYAEKDIVSDLATWSCSINLVSSSMQEGYDDIKITSQKIVDYLVANGFQKDSIKIEMLNSYPEHEYLQGGGQRKIGYRFTQAFSMQSTNIQKIADIAEKSQELMREGIEFTSGQPQYMYTKLNDLKVNMLSEATADAKVRAEQIAKSGANKITKIRSAHQGVFQITPLHSTEIYDYGMNDTYSVEKTIKSVVTVTYVIE